MIRPDSLGTLVAVATVFLVGCSQLTVQKAGVNPKTNKDEASGQSFYLPKVIMSLVPDKDLGYKVEWVFVPDRSQEYRIEHSASWASSDIKIVTEGGLLKSIKAHSDAGPVAKDAIEAFSAAREAKLAADLAVAKEKRTAADSALTAAQTELTALDTKVATAEATVVSAEATAATKKIDYDQAHAETQLQRDSLALAEKRLQEAIASNDSAKISAAENTVVTAKQAVNKAVTAEAKLEYELQAAKTALTAAITNRDNTIALRDLSKSNFDKLKAELPDKPVAVTFAADVAADAAAAKPVQRKAWIAAPVMFWVDTGAATGPLLKPMSMTVNDIETKYGDELKAAQINGKRIAQSQLLSIGVTQVPGTSPAGSGCTQQSIGSGQASISKAAGSLIVATVIWNCEIADTAAAVLVLQSATAGSIVTLDNPLLPIQAGTSVAVGRYKVEKKSGKTVFEVGLDQAVLAGPQCIGANACQIFIKERASEDSPFSVSIVKAP